LCVLNIVCIIFYPVCVKFSRRTQVAPCKVELNTIQYYSFMFVKYQRQAVLVQDCRLLYSACPTIIVFKRLQKCDSKNLES
jgi:hypothetical protein